jgi:hypothetical protein
MARRRRKSPPDPGYKPSDAPADMPPGEAATAPSPRAVVAAVAGLLAAWIGAGSMGLLAHPLRHALTWLAAAALLVAGWPQGRREWKEWGIMAAAILAGLILTVPATGVYSVLGVAVVLAVLSRMHTGCGKGVRHILPERPDGFSAQNVPDTFPAHGEIPHR